MGLVVDLHLLCARLVLLLRPLDHTPGLLTHLKVVVPEKVIISLLVLILLNMIFLACLDRT